MSLVCFGSLVVYVLLEHTTVMLWQHGGVVVAGTYYWYPMAA